MSAGGTTGGTTIGSGGFPGDAVPSVDYPAQGGAGGNTATSATVLDGPPVGGTAGSLDSPSVDTEAGTFGGAGGTTLVVTGGADGAFVDADIDAPLGGTGGVGPDGALDLGGGGRGDVGGMGGSGTGGKGTGGAGAGGVGTGGVTGTGGLTGTGGAGTGGSGIGGAGTGGAGTGGVTGTGGMGVVSTSGLLIYYPCDETSGLTLADASGNGRNATLVTDTGGSGGYNFKAGRVNNALELVKASQGYANIGANTAPFSAPMTVATWVYLNSSVSWQRVWDFGKDSTTYMFLSAKSSVTNFIRFGISTGSYSNEQGIDGIAELPLGAWHHVAVVLLSSGTTYTGNLYVDGTQVGTKTGMTLSPASLGTTTNNWIGKSQYYATPPTPDPYLDGSIDDFRVYGRALSQAEIQVLAAMKAP
jgi:Concanavalin A-like lectin/glucanases superfamily